MAEQLHFFPSLDFPADRTTLYLHEIAAKVGCTIQHLCNEVDKGELVGLNIATKKSSRRAMRIPVECYRAWVLRRLTGPVDFKMQFLRDLPVATRRQLIAELQASLRTHP
ncbi:MAG: hypothetical protein RL376_1968 [Verrucomicrobiota bacterium]|jgi:hypothetical protein